MINAKITGVGGYVPEKVYDNAYMESIVDTNDEWITRRTGIKERHISATTNIQRIWQQSPLSVLLKMQDLHLRILTL